MTETAGDLPLEASALTPERLAAILDVRDARVRAWGREAQAEPAAVVVLVARLGETLVGLPCDRLAAVAAAIRVTTLPEAVPALGGVFAHRGRLHALLHVDPALGLPPPAAPRTTALILRGGARALGLAVDDALEVTRAVPQGEGSRYAQAAGHGAVLLIDVDDVLAGLGLDVPGQRRNEAR